MKKIFSTFNLKLASAVLLILATAGFFYFESSLIIRILVIFLGLVGLIQMAKMPEILVMIDLYLSLFVLYNLRYGLAVPMSIILILVTIISVFLFYVNFRFREGQSIIRERFGVYLAVIGLLIVEIFLAMSFWPVDPKTKTLTIVILFFVFSRAVYFQANNMLSLKRISGILTVSVIVLVLLFGLSYWLGF